MSAVARCRRNNSITSVRRDTRNMGSSAANGSSSNNTLGLFANARANDTRCAWPPDNCDGVRCKWSDKPTVLASSAMRAARLSRSAELEPRGRPKPIFSATVKCGNKDESCGTHPILRRSGGRLDSLDDTNCPSIDMLPLLTGNNPAIERSNVVLPQPLGPRTATISAGSICKLMPSSAVCLP